MQESAQPATTIAVSCLSGGSGKSTTVLNLATMLATRGKTLIVDFDPQGNVSQWLGWTDLSQEATIAEAVLPDSGVIISEILKHPLNEERHGRLVLAPADYSLSHAAETISARPGRERFLQRALRPLLSEFDFIVIDSPPAKGILTFNALLAANFVVIPTECTNKGVMGAVNTLFLLQELAEIDFVVPHCLGILPTRDTWSGANQTRMSRAALAALQQKLPGHHLFSSIRQSTLVQQANNAGWSLSEAGESKLAQGYQEVINLILEKTHAAQETVH